MFFKSFIVTAWVSFFTGLGAIWVILLSFLNKLFPSLNNKVDEFVFLWAKHLNSLANVKVEVIGLENLTDGPCVFVFNHQSLFDIPILFEAIPKKLRFGAKKELFYIPFFGMGLKALGIFKIDRSQKDKAIRELMKSIDHMKEKNICLVLAPEGTRSPQNSLRSFKSGAFVTAIKAQVPVVPVVILGAYDVLPKNHFLYPVRKKYVCRVQVCKPIPTDNVSLDQREVLKKSVRDVILKESNYQDIT